MSEAAIRPGGRWATLLLPLIGIVAIVALWGMSSATLTPNLPSPAKTWQASKPYVLDPFEKRGELDQGILRFTGYSLWLVAKGYTQKQVRLLCEWYLRVRKSS